MENLSKKVGFLKGLMEGMDFDTTTANGKLMTGIVDLLSELSDRVETMDELLDELNDYVESIDDDLSELEGDFDDDDSDSFFDDDEDEDFADAFGASEDKLHLLHPSEDLADDEDDEQSLAGNLCPECHHMFFTSLDDPENAEYLCPHCEKRIQPEMLTPDNAPIASPVEE